MPCIDIHHHFIPASLSSRKRTENVGLGWKSPPECLDWSPELSLELMDAAGIDLSMLSFPAIASDEISQKSRRETRERNNSMSEICQKWPTRFGWFASLGCLDDVEGCLEEMAYALDVLKADGISLPSHSGTGESAAYVGHLRYEPIWRELDRRDAVVFIHGTQTPSSVPIPDPLLGVPITEVGNETFKAAAHLVVSGLKRQLPNTKIILSHAGGTLLSQAARIAALSHYMGCSLSPEEILEDFKTFYFDTALASYGPNLVALEDFCGIERIVFGTDLPAVNSSSAGWFTDQLAKHYARDTNALDKVLYQNALKLFPQKAASLGLSLEPIRPNPSTQEEKTRQL
ncbi:amidohydrolase 2 [Coprinopsis sp. MPI-PUGE-AT-0042]|nr:amidohydrolase 2 [Coprinopsis sp. MPI-PUGE-AT-0042]